MLYEKSMTGLKRKRRFLNLDIVIVKFFFYFVLYVIVIIVVIFTL